MAVHWQVFLPAVIFAHVLGAILLLYSLEKVSGLVSKTWKRITGPCVNAARTNDADQLRHNSDSGSVEIAKGAPLELEQAAQKVRGSTIWRRGCDCTVRCPLGHLKRDLQVGLSCLGVSNCQTISGSGRLPTPSLCAFMAPEEAIEPWEGALSGVHGVHVGHAIGRKKVTLKVGLCLGMLACPARTV
jgi:hypothetical protein